MVEFPDSFLYPKQINNNFLKIHAPHIRNLVWNKAVVPKQPQKLCSHYEYSEFMKHHDPIYYEVFLHVIFYFVQFVQQRSQRKNWWSLGSLIAFSFDILTRAYLQLFDLKPKLFIRCKGSCLFDCGVIKLPHPYQGVNNIIICHCDCVPLHSRQQQILFAKWWGNLHPLVLRVVTLPCWLFQPHPISGCLP